MPTLDIFNNDAFSLSSLTARANTTIPYVPGQIGASKLFEEDGVATLSVMVESLDGSLSLIEPTARGAAGENVNKDRAAMRSFVIPHFQRDDAVMADEVQSVRAFGTESEVQTVEAVVDGKVGRHARDLDATLEFTRVGAIKGVIMTKGGKTLANLFQAFEIDVPAVYSFDLSNAATLVREKSEQLVRMIEDELDTPYTGIDAWCGNTFWDKLTNHKSVRESYLNTSRAMELLGKEADTFKTGGITYRRYKTGKKATAANAGNMFIGADEVRFVPTGVPELFITRFAPADYMETVNTKGLPRYVKQWKMDNDKGVNLEIQSNPINLCTRPGVLRAGVTG